jgi:uncharacterized protein (DUF169 family)
MNTLEAISRDLVQSLRLQYEPVGVTLYRQGQAPPDIPRTQENLKSYCQALVLAGQGRTLLLSREQMGCKLGTSVLGMEPDMEAFIDDGVLEKYGVGLFATEEASARTIQESTYLEKGATQTVLIAPLAACPAEPQVVVFTANSEQVMWLLYAANYQRGGRQDLPQSGGALGGCSDITAPARRPAQHHLSGVGVPHQDRPGCLPFDDGSQCPGPGEPARPHPGHGQAHRHAVGSQVKVFRFRLCLYLRRDF